MERDNPDRPMVETTERYGPNDVTPADDVVLVSDDTLVVRRVGENVELER